MAEEVRKGTKISAEEAKTLDRSKMGVSITGEPPQAEVEGQARYWGYTECPHCGNVGRSVIDSARYLWYTCGRCGGEFRA
jgi:hypothetical protein